MPGAYLDNNATTPLLPEALAAMLPYFGERFGNPGSLHQAGQRTRLARDAARAQVARLIGARTDEIVFTSGGTESDNLALRGVLAPGDHVITSAVEHRAVLATCRRLEALGVDVTIVRVDAAGRVDPDEVRAALRPATRLVSVMMANNETGVLQPVEEIGRIAAEAEVWFHTDAVQAAGKVPVDVAQLGCHLLSLSGHKLHGPQGIGALYLRAGTPLRPLLCGGGQEGGRRAGTENIPCMVGLGAAAEHARGWLAAGGAAATAALRDRLESTLVGSLSRVRINGAGPRVPTTTNLSFEGIAGSALLVALDLMGVCASTGAACSAGSSEPPYVLRAMGLARDRAGAAVRFSLGQHTTSDEIDWALACVPDAVARLRALSPVWAALAPPSTPTSG
jgi:cysteine desulfurase